MKVHAYCNEHGWKHKFSLVVMSITSDKQWCCLFLVQKLTSHNIEITSFVVIK